MKNGLISEKISQSTLKLTLAQFKCIERRLLRHFSWPFCHRKTKVFLWKMPLTKLAVARPLFYVVMKNGDEKMVMIMNN